MTYRRRGIWYVDKQWRGMRLSLSTGTTLKGRATEMDSMLDRLRRQGRTDLLGLLRDRRIKLVDLYEAYDKGQLNQAASRIMAPPLRRLVGSLTLALFSGSLPD